MGRAARHDFLSFDRNCPIQFVQTFGQIFGYGSAVPPKTLRALEAPDALRWRLSARAMALDAGCAAVCDTESDAVLDAAAAAVAAVKALGADDPYGRSLSEWFVVIDDLADSDEQLPEPPKLDIRGLLDVLRTQRQAAHDAALACWRVLRGESVASIVAAIATPRRLMRLLAGRPAG